MNHNIKEYDKLISKYEQELSSLYKNKKSNFKTEQEIEKLKIKISFLKETKNEYSNNKNIFKD